MQSRADLQIRSIIELAEMMIVQASYEAAAKVITLVDELLDTVLTLL